MGFYINWQASQNKNEYIEQFLYKSVESLTSFDMNDKDELEAAYRVLSDTPFDDFFNVIANELVIDDNILPKEVPQFSSFEDGIQRVSELLEFSPEGIGFMKLGYQLVKPDKDGAATKYGENHAKIARLLSVVNITRTRPSALVVATSWGSYLLGYSLEEKKSVIQKLLLRDHIVQVILKGAASGEIKYMTVVKNLSESTALRRRPNVKHILEYVLKGTTKEDILKSIIW